MTSNETHKPYISANKILPEITTQGIILAILLGFLLTAANVYLGLYVGMTVSASIPAAVISMAVLRSLEKANLSKGTNILENNWVQTAVSSGESLAAGVIFTLPAPLPSGLSILPRIDEDVSEAKADVDRPNATTRAPAMRVRE